MKIKIIMLALSIFILVGCSQKISESGTKFANSTVENMLIAQNNNDYDKFAENLSSSTKKIFTKDEMDKQNKIVNTKIGKYIPNSKKFKQGTKVSQNGKKYIVVVYDVKYKNESAETTVTVTFDDDNKHAIETFIISSPKLMKK